MVLSNNFLSMVVRPHIVDACKGPMFRKMCKAFFDKPILSKVQGGVQKAYGFYKTNTFTVSTKHDLLRHTIVANKIYIEFATSST